MEEMLMGYNGIYLQYIVVSYAFFCDTLSESNMATWNPNVAKTKVQRIARQKSNKHDIKGTQIKGLLLFFSTS